ncbi:MAG: head decoration protein [Spiribacter salinus]|uniref:Head decoration protein n=1 Tax=Spiribacter salinus TaxID=1335746 RepID=A0A540VNU0_9GAMM|nr:MAG: head decoration protein [Spiribacter salinus]
MNQANFQTVGTYQPDTLLAGDFPRVERKLTIASGAGVLPRGSVVALDANGKAVLVDSASVEPSEQAPVAVLAHEVNATSADAQGIVYYTGEFNEDALTFGGSDTIADHRGALRALSIFTDTIIGA